MLINEQLKLDLTVRCAFATSLLMMFFSLDFISAFFHTLSVRLSVLSSAFDFRTSGNFVHATSNTVPMILMPYPIQNIQGIE